MMVVGVDCESHLIRQGWTSPRLVCLTLATEEQYADDLAAVLAPATAQFPDEVVRSKSVHTRPDGSTKVMFAYLIGRPAVPMAWAALVREAPHLVFHNASFDLCVLMNEVPEVSVRLTELVDRGRVWCSFLREKLIANMVGELEFRSSPWPEDEGKVVNAKKARVFSLAGCVSRYTRGDVDLRDEKTDPDAWRLRYSQLDGQPAKTWPWRAQDYALMDAVWPVLVIDWQNHALAPDVQGHPTRDPELPAARGVPRIIGELHRLKADIALKAAAGWGLRTNPDKVAAIEKEWTETSQAGQAIGERAGFIRVKGRDKGGKPGSKDTTKLRARVAAALGCPPEVEPGTKDERYTPTGKLSIATEVLEHCGDPVIEDFAGSLQATSWLGKYLPVLKLARFYPMTYGVDSLKSSGRCSTFKPSFHQPPRKKGYRECWEARPGCVFVSCDYGQAELRALAQFHLEWGLGDGLRDMFLAGLDPLLDMGAQLLDARGAVLPGDADQWDYETAQAAREGKYGPDFKKAAKDARQLAKAAMYGLPGGLGVPTFIKFAKASYGVVLTEYEARVVKNRWKSNPENGGYLREIERQLDGRRKFAIAQAVTGRIRGKCTYNSGANGYFQGRVADGFMIAAWSIFKESYTDKRSPLFGSRMVIALHDEFILETPEPAAAGAAKRLEELMIQGMAEVIPDVPIIADAAISRVWSKDVEPTFDEQGTLTVWEE